MQFPHCSRATSQGCSLENPFEVRLRRQYLSRMDRVASMTVRAANHKTKRHKGQESISHLFTTMEGSIVFSGAARPFGNYPGLFGKSVPRASRNEAPTKV